MSQLYNVGGPVKRAVYRIVARNEETGWSLVYIGQTTNVERRKAQHREGISCAMRRPDTAPELYRKLADDRVRGLLRFEVLEEGLPTLESALLREAANIKLHRRLRNTAVLNAVDRPEDAKMPTGTISARKYFGEYRLTIIAGLEIGDEAIGRRKNSDTMEIVRLKAQRSVAFQGRESWAFEETGLRWRDGHMPLHILDRVYRGFVKGIVRRKHLQAKYRWRLDEPDGNIVLPQQKMPPVRVITKVPKRKRPRFHSGG